MLKFIAGGILALGMCIGGLFHHHSTPTYSLDKSYTFILKSGNYVTMTGFHHSSKTKCCVGPMLGHRTIVTLPDRNICFVVENINLIKNKHHWW